MGQANFVDFLPNRKHVKTAVAVYTVNRTISNRGLKNIVKRSMNRGFTIVEVQIYFNLEELI